MFPMFALCRYIFILILYFLVKHGVSKKSILCKLLLVVPLFFFYLQETLVSIVFHEHIITK